MAISRMIIDYHGGKLTALSDGKAGVGQFIAINSRPGVFNHHPEVIAKPGSHPFAADAA
jgi:hypothetical protein